MSLPLRFNTALLATVSVLPELRVPPVQLDDPVMMLLPWSVPLLQVKLLMLPLTPSTVPPASNRFWAVPLIVSVPPVTLELPAPVNCPLPLPPPLNVTVPLSTFTVLDALSTPPRSLPPRQTCCICCNFALAAGPNPC
jgi:hypothetical protein